MAGVPRRVELVSGRVVAKGDSDRGVRGGGRVLGATGSTRQRAAYERTGSLEGVVDDVLARTRDSWASPNTADRA